MKTAGKMIYVTGNQEHFIAMALEIEGNWISRGLLNSFRMRVL